MKVIGIKFKEGGKIYYFAPQKNVQYEENMEVVVETAKSIEIAKVAFLPREVEDGKVTQPLKPVIRIATDKDRAQRVKNIERKPEAMRIAQEKIAKHGLKMKLVDAEYTFDRSKIVFSFTAEGRVDFRELVKDIAGVMHMRIELRQIYERDDIKMRGALAMCGRPCCCTTHLSDYEKVTVKMAKNQNISLNPTKVSGMCGKLMCCLRYENDYYVETAKILPKVGTPVSTAKGNGKVEETDMLKRRIKVAIQNEDGIINEYFEVGEFEVIGAPQKQKQSKEEEQYEKELRKLEE